MNYCLALKCRVNPAILKYPKAMDGILVAKLYKGTGKTGVPLPILNLSGIS